MKKHEKIKLAVFDIDGTLRVVRSPWRHLHQYLGLSEQAKEFFPMFSRGDISYEKWVELDASLWKGISKHRILGALSENPLREGALELVRYFKDKNIPCIAISTGLSVFANETKKDLKLDKVVCNDLLFNDDDECTGIVDICVTEHNKKEVLSALLLDYNVSSEEVIVFGDGSADYPMFELAAIKVAIFPSDPQLKISADVLVEDASIDVAILDIEKI